MSITSETSSVSYVGNNSTVTAYAVPFKFYAGSDLKVTATSAMGVVTTLAYPAGFTVTGAGSPSGGTVKTTAAWGATYTVKIKRYVPLKQLTVFSEGQRIPNKILEKAFDWVTMQVQRVWNALSENTFDTDAHIANTVNPHAVTKAQVGLGSADNTSDASKPVSGPQAAAIAVVAADAALKIPLIQRGAANGVASLDEYSKIPVEQMPGVYVTAPTAVVEESYATATLAVLQTSASLQDKVLTIGARSYTFKSSPVPGQIGYLTSGGLTMDEKRELLCIEIISVVNTYLGGHPDVIASRPAGTYTVLFTNRGRPIDGIGVTISCTAATDHIAISSPYLIGGTARIEITVEPPELDYTAPSPGLPAGTGNQYVVFRDDSPTGTKPLMLKPFTVNLPGSDFGIVETEDADFIYWQIKIANIGGLGYISELIAFLDAYTPTLAGVIKASAPLTSTGTCKLSWVGSTTLVPPLTIEPPYLRTDGGYLYAYTGTTWKKTALTDL